MTTPPEMTMFAEIRFEIERTLVKVELAEGEDKRFLLRRLRILIAQADKAILSQKRNPAADNPPTHRDLDMLRNVVKTAMDASELNRKT
jgi:hypothetical protein